MSQQHRSRAFWAKLVAEYEQVASTQSLRAFARARGVPESSLSRWRHKLRREREVEQRLVPVVLRPAEPVLGCRDKAQVIVRLGTEPALDILDHARVSPQWVAELLTELAKVSG